MCRRYLKRHGSVHSKGGVRKNKGGTCCWALWNFLPWQNNLRGKIRCGGGATRHSKVRDEVRGGGTLVPGCPLVPDVVLNAFGGGTTELVRHCYGKKQGEFLAKCWTQWEKRSHSCAQTSREEVKKAPVVERGQKALKDWTGETKRGAGQKSKSATREWDLFWALLAKSEHKKGKGKKEMNAGNQLSKNNRPFKGGGMTITKVKRKGKSLRMGAHRGSMLNLC